MRGFEGPRKGLILILLCGHRIMCCLNDIVYIVFYKLRLNMRYMMWMECYLDS